MFDIAKTIKLMIVSEGTSMKKIVQSTRNTNLDIPSESTISNQLKSGRIRLRTFLDIAGYLGYEVNIQKKKK